MSTFDEIARRALSNENAQGALDNARARNQINKAQASARQSNKVGVNNIVLGGSQVRNSPIKTSAPLNYDVAATVAGSVDTKETLNTFGDEFPVIQGGVETTNRIGNTLNTGLGFAAGTLNSVIGYNELFNQSPYEWDSKKSFWENLKDRYAHDVSQAMTAMDTVTYSEDRDKWVEQGKPNWVKTVDAERAGIYNAPNLSDEEKGLALAKMYKENPEYAGREGVITVGQVIGETVIGGGALKAVGAAGKLSQGAKVFTANALPTGVNHLDQRHKESNGNLTSEDLGAATLVGAGSGVIGWGIGRVTPMDIEGIAVNGLSSTRKALTGEIGKSSSRIGSSVATAGMSIGMGGIEEAGQSVFENAVSNYQDGKALMSGAIPTAVDGAVLGMAGQGVVAAPSAAVGTAGDAVKLTGAGVAVAGKATVGGINWAREKLSSDAVKAVNAQAKTYHDNLAKMGQEADDNDPKQSMEVLSGTLNNLAKQRDDLAEKLKTTTDPKQKKKLQKDYDHATKIYEDISTKHEVAQSEYYKSLSPEEITRLFIEKQRTYQYELSMMGGASIPKTPYTATYSPTSSTIPTNTNANTGTTNAIIRMGKYQFNNGKQTNADDVGRGSGDHIDFHVVSKKGVNPAQYTDRFIVADGKHQGKTLLELLNSKTYTPSGQQAFGAQRDGYKHSGIDFDGRIGGGVAINPKYQIKNVTAHHNPNGYGHYVQVHFTDGISIGLGHMGKANVDAFMQAYKGTSKGNNKGTQQASNNTQYTMSRELNLSATPYDGLMKEIYTKHGFNEQEQRILRTQLAQESGFNPNEGSHKGAKGIAQFLDDTAKQYGVDVNDVASSIDGQARFMKDLLKKTNGNWEMALAFYNAGAGSTDAQTRFNKVKNYKETRNYYNNILHHAGVGANHDNASSTSTDTSSTTELEQTRSRFRELQAQFEQEENAQRQQEMQEQMEQMQARITELETVQGQPNQTNTAQEGEQTQPTQTTAEKLSDLIRYSRQTHEKEIATMLEAGALTEEEANTLRVLDKTTQMVNEHKNGDTVVGDVYKGNTKRTVEESSRGLTEYQDRIVNAVIAKDLSGMDKLADDLYRWEESHTSKAKASQQAWELFQSTGKPHTIARQEGTQEWRVYEGETLTPEQRSQTGAMVIKGFSKKYVQQVMQEAAHIQQMASNYHSLLKDSPNIPARRLQEVGWIDFDSINIPTQRVNAQTGAGLTRGGMEVARNPFELDSSVSTTSVEPVTARTTSKIDDLITSKQPTTSTFKDHNPQVTHRHKNVSEYKQQYSNDTNSVWLGRGNTDAGKTVSISNFVFSSTRTNKDTGEKEFYNNLVTPAGGVKDGVFGMATNLHDINTKKPSVKADVYNIIHDGTSEGIQSAQIEAVNRFTDMIRLGVQSNYNFANALVQLANNPDTSFHGSNHIGNAYTEATVMRELLPVVADVIKGYKDPKNQQQQIINALDNIGTMMSDGKYHSEVPRPLQLNDEAKGIHKLQYDNTVVHGTDSLANVWQGESVSSPTPSISAMDTATQLGETNDLLQQAGMGDVGYDMNTVMADDTAITDIPVQDEVISPEHAEKVSNQFLEQFNAVTTGNEPKEVSMIKMDNEVVSEPISELDAQIINEPVAPKSRANGIAVNKAKNANIKVPHKLGMDARNPNNQLQTETQDDTPTLDSITDKAMPVRDVMRVLNPVKPVTETKKGNTHPKAVHHAEIQSIIEALDTHHPDMQVEVVSADKAKKLSQSDTNDDVIYIHKNSKDVHTELAKQMMSRTINKVADELDALTDEDVANAREFDSLLKETNPDKSLSEEESQVLNRTRKLMNVREDLKAASRQVAKYLRTNKEVPTELQTKVLQLINRPSDMMHYGLMDNDVKTLFKSIKMPKSKGAKSKVGTVYQAIKSALSKYLGFNPKQESVYEKVLEGFSGAVELSVTDGAGTFLKSSTAKLSAFQDVTDIHAEHKKSLRPVKDKISESKNVLVTYFKQIQNKSKPLSSIPDFVNNLVVNPIKAAQALKLDTPNEAQLKQVQDFGLFHHEFKNFLEEVVIKKTAGYEYASMASYLVDEHGQVDENLLAAMSYTAYDFIIANGNHIRHTDDEIKQLLGLYDERDREAVYLSKYLRDTYQYRGFVYDIQAQKIGERVAKTLNISASELGSKELDNRLYGALGGWVLSAMQAADLVHITQMSTTKHLSNMALVNLSQANEQGKTVSEHSQTRFVAMSDLKGENINPLLQEIITTNKGTSGYLSDVFGGVSGIRNPLTKPPEQGKVKRSIKKTKAQVADVQAELVDKAQQEAMVVNEHFDKLITDLVGQHEDTFMQMIGASVSDEALYKSHINERAGMLGKADGIKREFTNAINFFDGLKKDDEGERKFYDTMFMAVNTRMHLNSNVVNIQSSKLHRAWADHKSYQYEIKDPKKTLSSLLNTLAVKGREATIKDFNENELQLLVFLRALGENMEGSEDAVKGYIKQDPKLADTFVESFTVDKLPSYIFIPAFMEFLKQPVITQALSTIDKALNNETISKDEMNQLADAVKATDMGASGLRALMEWSRFNHHSDKGNFKTSLGLGSDGINNGVMIAHVSSGVADDVMLNRTGLYTHDSDYDTYFDSRHDKGVGDYYTAFKDKVLSDLYEASVQLGTTIKNTKQKGEDTSSVQSMLDKYTHIQELFSTLESRKAAKDVLVPVNYASGETSTKLSVYRSFLGDIQSKLSKIANEAVGMDKEQSKTLYHKDVQPLIRGLNIIMGRNANTPMTLEMVDADGNTKELTITEDTDLTLLNESWFDTKTEAVIQESFLDSVGANIWRSLEDYEGGFLESNKRNIAVLTAAAELYMTAYEYHIQKAKDTKLQALIDKYQSAGLDNARANKLAKDELEFIGLSYAEIEQVEQELEHLNPTVHTAHSIQDNDTKAKVRLVNTISQTVSDNSELTQNNFYQMNTDGMLQSTMSASATKKQVMEAQARKVNSIQTQSQDARVASMIMTAGDGVHGNVHDAGITGGKHYYTMGQAQNKAMYETLRDYSTPVESLNTLVDALSRFKDYMKTHNENADFMTVYKKALAVAMQNEPRVSEGDTQRKHIVSSLKNMQQYGAEFGEYVITKAEANKTQEIFKKQEEKLSTLKDTLNTLALDMGQAVMSQGLKDKAVAIKDTQIIAVGYTADKHIWSDHHNRYGFSGGYLSVNHLDDLSHAQLMQARKLLSPKKLKELDKSRKTDKEAQAEYTQEIVTAHAVNEADAVYLVDSFYENKEGKIVQSAIAKGLLYKAKQQGKPIFANDMDGNWLTFDMVQDDWIMLQAPLYLPQKPLINNGYKKTAGLNDLLVMVDMNHQALMRGDLSSIMDKPFTLKSQLATLSQAFNEDTYGTALLNRLAQINPDVTIELVSDINRLDKMVQAQVINGGMYYPNENKVIININPIEWQGTLLELINHELTHSVTVDVIGFDDADKLTDAQQEMATDIQFGLMDWLNDNPELMSDYVNERVAYAIMTNFPHELMAVFTAENSVRNEVKQHNPELFSNIQNFIKSIMESKNELNQRTDANQGQRDYAQDVSASTQGDSANLSRHSNQDWESINNDGAHSNHEPNRKSSPKNQNEVAKTFTINDIKKAVAAREKTQAVGALFDAYMSVAEKHYPNLTLRMASEGNFNAYYSNGQITVNESVWNTLSDNDKVRLINHELSHAVTLAGLKNSEHEAVKDLHKMYDYLKGVYTKGTHTVLDEVFYPTDADGNNINDKRVGVAELVAYGTENKVVAEFIADNLDLRKADVKQNNKLGVLEQFYAAVTAILAKVGFKLPYKTFLASVNEVIELGQESSGREQLELFNKTLDDDSTIDDDYDKSLHTIYDGLLDDTISDEHSEHLSNLMGKIYSPVYESLLLDEQAVEKYQDATIMYAPTNLFSLSPKEAFAYSALATTTKHLLDNHKDNQIVIELAETIGQMIAHYDDVYKLFPDYDSMTESQKEQANKQFASLFYDVTSDPNKAIAHIAGVMMTSQDLKDRLNIKIDKATKLETKGWFNKAMSAIYKLLNMFRDKYLHQADTSQDSIAELLTKLAKIDANVRMGKKNLVDTVYENVYTKPMDYANQLVNKGLDKGLSVLDNKLNNSLAQEYADSSENTSSKVKLAKAAHAVVNNAQQLRNHEKILKEVEVTDDMSENARNASTEYNKRLDQNNPTQSEVALKSLDMVMDDVISITSEHSKETAHLLEEMRGIHDNPSYVLERMTAYNTKANNARNTIKDNVKSVISNWFNRELTVEDEEAMTRTLLMTDAQSLLGYHSSDGQVLDLVLNKKARAKRVEELITRLEHLIPEQHIREDMIIQSMSLGYYMATETTVPNVLKSAEMIATSSGTGWAKSFDEMDKDVFAAVDELTTLYALDRVKSKYRNTTQALSEKHGKAVIKVLRLQQDNVKDSKEAFRDNPLNYTKGYIPAIHDAHTDVKVVVAEDVQKYLDEGYEMVQEEPLPQDSLDKTEPRYLLVNKNYAATRRVSGALDLKDSHTKGFEVYHYKKDGKALSEVAKELQTLRYNTIKAGYKNFNPENHQGSNLIPIVGTDGAIISYNMEMTGAVRDSVLKRDLSLTMLMGTQRASLDINPQIKQLQSRMSEEIVKMVKDPTNGFKKRPHLYTAISRNSSNPEIQEMFKLLPYEFVNSWEKQFGKSAPIIIPKMSENLIFGFSKWTVAEWFDKATGEKNAYQKLVTQLYRKMYGQQAKNKAAEHQRVWEWFIGQAKDVIVIRSIQVLKGNIIANMLMLALQGVPISNIVTDTMYAWREGTRYMAWQNEAQRLKYEISASNDPQQIKEMTAKVKKLEFQLQSSGIHEFMQEGIMSSIVEGVEVVQESKVFKSDFETSLDNIASKIPKPVREVGKQLIMHPDTDVHKFLTKMTQFSDMTAKYTLARHVQRQQMAKGKSKQEAFKAGISAAQETFLNYDVPTSRSMQALNDLGIFNFTKFTLRFQKAMLKQLHQNTGHTIAQHFLAENLLDTSGVLNPLGPFPNMGWGAGTVTSAVTELPVYKLFFE